jgi:hypothetical protein
MVFVESMWCGVQKDLIVEKAAAERKEVVLATLHGVCILGVKKGSYVCKRRTPLQQDSYVQD